MTPRKKVVSAGTAAGAPDRRAPEQVSGKNDPGKAGKEALSRERILAAAMSIIDQEGFEALSMRRLGRDLGVDPMSVYYHIPNKSALLDALVESVMSSIDLSIDDPGRPAAERLMWAARTYRETLLKHANLIQAGVCLAPRTPAALRPVEVLIQIFVDAGFDIDDAFTAMNVLASYVRGSVSREVTEGLDPHVTAAAEADFSQLAQMLPPEEFPYLVRVNTGSKCLEAEVMFDCGARALIRGLLEMYGNGKEE